MANQKERYTPALAEYLNDFGLVDKDLSGKRILDAGAGLRHFARDCAEIELGEVWSLDKSPQDWLTTKEIMKQVEGQNPKSEWLKPWQGAERYSIGGLFQELPFADGGFDLVLSRNGLTQALETEAELVTAMKEAIRVVRPGGEVRIFPGWLDCWSVEKVVTIIRAVNQIADEPGIKLEVKRVEMKIAGITTVGSLLVIRKD